MSSRRYRIETYAGIRNVCTAIYQLLIGFGQDGFHPVEIVIKQILSPRTRAQNNRMWSRLGDIARQKEWPVDGELVYLTTGEWKDVFTAALVQELRVARGINGGVVLLGRRTSKMSAKALSDLIYIIEEFGDSNGIIWTPIKKQLEKGLEEQ